MSKQVMRGYWQQFYGHVLEMFGSARSDSKVWIKGRHVRINGMLMVCESRSRLALARSAARHSR